MYAKIMTRKVDGEQWTAQAATLESTSQAWHQENIVFLLCDTSRKYTAHLQSILDKKLHVNLITHLSLISFFLILLS